MLDLFQSLLMLVVHSEIIKAVSLAMDAANLLTTLYWLLDMEVRMVKNIIL